MRVLSVGRSPRPASVVWAAAKSSWPTIGAWATLSDHTHSWREFQRSLVVWPRPTSSTSIRTSSLRCLFHTWWPV
nr:hypothetical protein [Streptosporangium carneum]